VQGTVDKTYNSDFKVSGGLTNLYSYVGSDPINLRDPRGLDVERCRRQAHLPGAETFDWQHEWLRTDDAEAGQGACDPDGWFKQDTCLVDHIGEGDLGGATCESVPNENEACVTNELQNNKEHWLWPVTTCDEVADQILQKCQSWGGHGASGSW
jgi:hypothetical protein